MSAVLPSQVDSGSLEETQRFLDTYEAAMATLSPEAFCRLHAKYRALIPDCPPESMWNERMLAMMRDVGAPCGVQTTLSDLLHSS